MVTQEEMDRQLAIEQENLERLAREDQMHVEANARDQAVIDQRSAEQTEAGQQAWIAAEQQSLKGQQERERWTETQQRQDNQVIARFSAPRLDVAEKMEEQARQSRLDETREERQIRESKDLAGGQEGFTAAEVLEVKRHAREVKEKWTAEHEQTQATAKIYVEECKAQGREIEIPPGMLRSEVQEIAKASREAGMSDQIRTHDDRDQAAVREAVMREIEQERKAREQTQDRTHAR